MATKANYGTGWNNLGSTPQWDAVNAIPHLKDQFSGLGFTGDLYGYGASSNTGGESGMDFQGGGPQVSAGLQSWLDENKYSLQGQYDGPDLQMRIADANGATVGNSTHYDTNDGGWFEKAVPFAIAAMGGGAIGQGLGLWGSGAGLGAEAALPASQIGAMTPALESMLPSIADVAAWESALPGMTSGMTVGGGLAAGAAGAAGLGGGLGGALSSGLSALGGAKSLLPALGAIAGGLGAGKDQTQTTQNQLDPRMASMLYGDNGSGGFLNQAQDYFNSTKGGNALMTQGADAMKAAYTNPQAQQGFNAMQTQGMGLLSGGGQNDFLDAFKNRKTSAMPDLSQFKQPRGLLG